MLLKHRFYLQHRSSNRQKTEFTRRRFNSLIRVVVFKLQLYGAASPPIRFKTCIQVYRVEAVESL